MSIERVEGDDSSMSARSQRTSVSAPARIIVSAVHHAPSPRQGSSSVGCESFAASTVRNDGDRPNNISPKVEAAAAIGGVNVLTCTTHIANDHSSSCAMAAAAAIASGTNNGKGAYRATAAEEDPPPRTTENPMVAADAASSSTSPPPGEDDEGGEQHQDIVLDAEVELLTPLPPPSPPRPSARRRRHQHGPEEGPATTMCGVPVAQPISDDCDPSDDGDEGGDVSSTDNQGIFASGNDPSLPIRLQHLGHDVVIATMEEIMEEGQQAGDEKESSPSQTPPDNIIQSSPVTEEDQHPTNKYTPGCSRRGYIWSGIILAVLVVAGVGFGLGTKKENKVDDADVESQEYRSSDANNDGNIFDTDSLSPDYDYSEDHKMMLQLLEPFLSSSGYDVPMIRKRPQHEAVEWLISTSFGASDTLDLSPWVNLIENTTEPLPTEQQERLIQRYVLAVLYYSTTGQSALTEEENYSGWHDSSFFLADMHECEWNGVTCDGDMRVIELDLANNNLSGTLPPNELHGLPHLRKINLSLNSKLGGTLPEDIGDLPDLHTLLLAHNALTGTLPPSLGNLSSLEELNLVDNDLEGSVPVEVRRMTSLNNIWLNQNRFTDGMENFCQNDIRASIFYADCFCREFPRLEPEVSCSCCTICCARDGPREICQPNAPCNFA